MLSNVSLNSNIYIWTNLVLPNENLSLKEITNWFLPDNTRISGMQINHFMPLTGLSKPSTSSSSFSSPQNKTAVLRNTLAEHTAKEKFPSAQMLSPPPPGISVFKMFFKWKGKEEQLAVVSIKCNYTTFYLYGCQHRIALFFRGLWEWGENIILICIKPVTELSIFASSCSTNFKKLLIHLLALFGSDFEAGKEENR